MPGHFHVTRPIKAAACAHRPRCAVVLDIGKHDVQLLWCLGILHHEALAHRDDGGDMVNVDRASLGAGIASRASPEFLGGDEVVEQGAFGFLGIGLDGIGREEVLALQFLHAVARVHDDFPRRKFFAREIGGANIGATATFRAGVGIHQVGPGQVDHVACAETGDRAIAGIACGARIHHGFHLAGDEFNIVQLALGLELARIHIGEGHDDVEVLGAGNVVEQQINADDMAPPACHHDKFGGQGIRPNACEHAADRENAMLHAGSQRSKVLDVLDFDRIERKQESHQYDFRDQDDIGIQARPTAHFDPGEALDFHDVAAVEQHHAGDDDEQAQNFIRSHQRIIARSEETQKPVGTKDSVHEDLQQFDVDDQKADIDEAVQDGGQRFFEHFLLSKCHE